VYEGPVIDLDIHHSRVHDHELLEYLSTDWQEFLLSPGEGKTVSLMPPGFMTAPADGNNKRLDAFPDEGPPASDYAMLCDQLLDPCGVEIALLGHELGHETALPNPDLAHALAAALNDWSLDVWLEGKGDDRLHGAIIVPTHYPEKGADEVRRVGQHPKFISALMPYNALGRPFGHPSYHPIYEACVEMDLPAHWHAGGGEFFGGSGPYMTGGSSPHYRFEVYCINSQATQNHLTSMIVHGVFEKYPSLRLICAETGTAWLPWLAASLDSHYDILRRESKWVRRLPSEYLREHVVFTTQPSEGSVDDRHAFIEHLSLFEGIERMLCFSSDYPHWDADPPWYIDAVLPKSWHDGVFHENARRVLRLPNPPVRTVLSPPVV
jgi:predicted TIM-barrel fold metal-dependent hydrolase